MIKNILFERKSQGESKILKNKAGITELEIAKELAREYQQVLTQAEISVLRRQ
jgi:hypothetical protein